MITKQFRALMVTALLLSATFMQSQIAATRYFDTWRLGERGTLKFDGAQLPVATANTGPFFLGRENSISDPVTGDLLFSAGNNWLHEADGDTMVGSLGLYTLPEAMIPHPGNNDLFYVLSEVPGARYSYTLVDMSMNGGQGAVVPGVKEIAFGPAMVSTRMQVFSSPNGTTHWLVGYPQYSNEFVVYAVTAQSGLDTVGLTYEVAPPVSGPHTGQLGRISHNNDQMMVKQGSGQYYLYQLDAELGSISNGQLLPFDHAVQWFEFSPDGHYLYVGTYQTSPDTPPLLYQYDLSAGSPADIIASQYAFPATSQMLQSTSQGQLGPDGRLWCVPGGGTSWELSHLVYLKYPNEAGAAAELDTTGLYLGQEYVTQAVFPFQFWPAAAPNSLAPVPSASLGVLQANPSPTVGTVTFTYDRPITGGSIQVQDASGRVVETLSVVGGGNTTYQAEHLPSGVYLAVLRNKEGIPVARATWVRE